MSGQFRDGDQGESERVGDGGAVNQSLASILRNESRRRVLRHLCREEGTASLMGLAVRLQSANDRTLPDVIESLHENHLPRLEKHGVVERTDESTVELRVDPERVEQRLDDWSRE